MPVHDWTRVDAGVFHAFHNAWITHLAEDLNNGVLPHGYYAMGEQIAARKRADILALKVPFPTVQAPISGGVAVADAEPQVSLRVKPRRANPTYHRLSRSVSIRHLSDHEIVAFIEIVSRANKDRQAHVDEVVEKVVKALEAEISVVLLDLLPPGRHDPLGVHGAVWDRFDDEPYVAPPGKPLTMVSYNSPEVAPEAYLEPVAVGDLLVDMPLFLNSRRYVNVPLERSYMAAYLGMPEFWRNVIEGKPNP